jgi:hypothetical protein
MTDKKPMMRPAYCFGEKPFHRVFPRSMLDYFQTAFEKRARWVFIALDLFGDRIPCCVSAVSWDRILDPNSNTVEVEFRRVYFVKEVRDDR